MNLRCHSRDEHEHQIEQSDSDAVTPFVADKSLVVSIIWLTLIFDDDNRWSTSLLATAGRYFENFVGQLTVGDRIGCNDVKPRFFTCNKLSEIAI